MALGFYFNQSICIGCRTCQIACKDRNDLEVGHIYRTVTTFETGKYPDARAYHYSAACNHCENPKCVAGCPTGAMYKAEDGTVQHDDDMCIGCDYCAWNCPYGVPQYFDALGITGKCDSCAAERAAGGNPVCVDACLMRALEFGDLDELKAKHADESLVQELPILPEASITNPSILIYPRTAALSSDFAKKEI